MCDVVESCEWDDHCVELEVWTRLTKLARLQKNHSLVARCSDKALGLENEVVRWKNNKMNASTT